MQSSAVMKYSFYAMEGMRYVEMEDLCPLTDELAMSRSLKLYGSELLPAPEILFLFCFHFYSLT